MEALNNININSLLDTFVSLMTAFILGGLIGLERQYRQRTAGLRTNVLVAVGAAVFVDVAFRLTGKEGAVHVVAYVVSGIGFLGAGVIMKEDGGVRGLNTAATLWGAGGVGACAGADLLPEAVLAALFVLAANTLLRPMVNAINRIPINVQSSEVTYSVCIICNQRHQKEALEQLEFLLESASYPLGDFEVRPFTQHDVQIFAKLLRTSVDSHELNRVIEQLMAIPSVTQAFWSPSTTV